MKIHEYQAIGLLDEYGVLNRGGIPAETASEAVSAAEKTGGEQWVIKAMVHTGGRGKAGGVKIANGLSEVERIASDMLGMTLVTKQTGPEGKLVRRIMVSRCVSVTKEYYLSITVDPDRGGAVIIASSEGGTEIEETAARSPEKILKEWIDPVIGLRGFQIRFLAGALHLPDRHIKAFEAIVRGAYRLFSEKDCSLLEINPLVETGEGELLALDIKLDFDENALFRHKDILSLRDIYEEDEKERLASQFGLNYIPLSGNIGCMVNGAGLAMATMDIIKAYGGEPANFLDVGGGASAEKIAGAFKILMSDGNVKGILINIFGGIMRCDVLARGIAEAALETGLSLPVVVRLEGTNAEEGKDILRRSGLSVIPAEELSEAVRKIVSLTGGAGA